MALAAEKVSHHWASLSITGLEHYCTRWWAWEGGLEELCTSESRDSVEGVSLLHGNFLSAPTRVSCLARGRGQMSPSPEQTPRSQHGNLLAIESHDSCSGTVGALQLQAAQEFAILVGILVHSLLYSDF